MRKILLIGVAVVALVATTAGSCGSKDKGDKFTRDCTARGGHVSTHREGHKVTRVCLPPPTGW